MERRDVKRDGLRHRLASAAEVLIAAGACLLAPGAARANFPFPQLLRTGAPLPGGGHEPTCSDLLCHCNGSPCAPPIVSSANFGVSIDPPAYTPTSLHLVTVTITHAGQQRWGFELQALDAALARAGTFAAGPGTGVTDDDLFGRQYAHHLHVCPLEPVCVGPEPAQCEEPAIPDGTTWTFEWQAPAEDVGTVTFYAVGNAANGVPPPPCGLALGDFIYGATVAVPVPEPGRLASALAGLVAALAASRAGRRRVVRRVAGSALAAAALLAPGAARAYHREPPIQRTGAPLPTGGFEATCANFRTGCHPEPIDAGRALGGDFRIAIDPPSYSPGSLHQVTVAISQPGQQRWGFELQALDAGLARAGTFMAGSGSRVTQDFFLGRQYIHHLNPCTITRGPTCPRQCQEPPIPDGHSWTFSWRAPGQEVGTVILYATGNAANGAPPPACDLPFSDFIYSASVAVPLPEPGPATAALAGLATALVAGRVWRALPAGSSMGRG
jgi:hypothetical protein